MRTILIFLSVTFPFLAFGVNLPAFKLPKLTEQGDYSNKELEGHLSVIDFWASWCGPCEETFPFYKKLHSDFEKKGLLILAISLDEDESAAKAFVKERSVSYFVAIDKVRDFKRSLGIKSIPTALLVNGKGEILTTIKGSDEAGLKLLRTKITEVLK